MDYKWFDTVRLYIKDKKKDGAYEVIPVSSDSYNYDHGSYTELEEFVSIKNGGLRGIVLNGLKKRSKSVYIISLNFEDNTYEFEMKSKYVTNMLLSGGVSSGGILNGKYSFIRIGEETRLVYEGSAECMNAKAYYAEYSKVKKELTRNTLVPGRVYAVEDPEYSHFLYLGEMYVWECEDKELDVMNTRMVFLFLKDEDVTGLVNKYDLGKYGVLVEDDVFVCRDITEEREYDVVDVDELNVELIKRYDFKLAKVVFYIEQYVKSMKKGDYLIVDRCEYVESTFSRTQEEFERRVTLYKELIKKKEIVRVLEMM